MRAVYHDKQWHGMPPAFCVLPLSPGDRLPLAAPRNFRRPALSAITGAMRSIAVPAARAPHAFRLAVPRGPGARELPQAAKMGVRREHGCG